MSESTTVICLFALTVGEQVFIGIVTGVTVAVVGFLIWCIQRWITKASEGEALGRVKDKTKVRATLKEQGLPYSDLDEPIRKELLRIRQATGTKIIDREEARIVAAAMNQAAELSESAGGTVSVPVKQMELINELVRVLFNQLVDSNFSAIEYLDWLLELDHEDARIHMLSAERDVGLLKILATMREMNISVEETAADEITRYTEAIDLDKLEEGVKRFVEICDLPDSLLQSLLNDLNDIREAGGNVGENTDK